MTEKQKSRLDIEMMNKWQKYVYEETMRASKEDYRHIDGIIRDNEFIKKYIQCDRKVCTYWIFILCDGEFGYFDGYKLYHKIPIGLANLLDIKKHMSKNGKLTYKKTLSRKNLLKLLYNPLKNNNELDRDTLKLIYARYPIIKKLLELMFEFKGIILSNKSEKALSIWFKKAKKLNLDCINTFIRGCYNDMPAIINSIKYQYSNGVVEASVNKIKLVKRIMHGRCKFDLLKSKTLRLEFLCKFN